MGCKLTNIKPSELWIKEEENLKNFIEKYNVNLTPAQLRKQLSQITYKDVKTLEDDVYDETFEQFGGIEAYEELRDLMGEANQNVNLYLSERGLSLATQKYLNEGMVSNLMNVLTDVHSYEEFSNNLPGTEEENRAKYLTYLNNRSSYQMDIAELMDYKGDKQALSTAVARAYGMPGVSGSVYTAVEHGLNDIYNTKLSEWQAAPENSFAKEVLGQELDNLDFWLDEGGVLESLWPSLVDSNLEFLSRLGLVLDREHIQQNLENVEELEQDESSEDAVISRDTLGITASNEINPLTRIKPDLKLILKTLPAYKIDGSPIVNKLGLKKLADFGKTMSILYSALANTNDNYSKVIALQNLADQNETFNQLLKRLNLQDVNEPADLENLSQAQFNLYTSFMTAFNNAKDAYSFMNVTSDGNRTMVDSNAESTANLVKLKWGENFKYNIQQIEGLGEVKGGRSVVNLDYNFKGTPIRTLLESNLDINQKLDLLELLGIKFTDRVKAQQKIDTNEDTLNSINWIFQSILYDRSVSNLMKGDESANIKNLVDVQTETDLLSGTLQFNSITGRKKYAITLKGFINVLADNLNEDASELTGAFGGQLASPTFLNSQYLERLKSEKIEIGVIDGIRNERYGRGKEISSSSKSNITALHVGSILQGAVPLVRTGNKKLERTIKVGTPDYSRGIVRMQQQMLGYLESEIRAAHHIKSNNITDIKGLNSELQYFAHPSFSGLQPAIASLIQKDLSEEDLGRFLNSTEVSTAILNYLTETVQSTKEILTKYNVVTPIGAKIQNVGFDPNTLKKIAQGKKVSQDTMAIIESELDKGYITPDLLQMAAEQITFIREEGIIEQIKLFLGHPSVYSDLFKRTSGLVSPKKYPDSSEVTMRLLDKYYPNQVGEHRRTARFVTRKEVKEESEYLQKYKDHLVTLGRPDLLSVIDGAYKQMEVFDGGGLIHIDFYRKARVLTSSWGKELEAVYQKIINNEDLGVNDLVAMSPLKPQVLAAIDHKGIDIRMFNKFALYPIHPNLAKLVSDKTQGNKNVLDNLYDDMVANDLDYTVFESGTKAGARMNSENRFEDFVDENGMYSPLSDQSSIQEYDLRYFGVQQDPKDDRGTGQVTAGTQSGVMLPTNIFEDSILSDEYAATSFSKTETWEQAIDRYHGLTSTLIERDMSKLARELGFKRTPSNDFEMIDSSQSKEVMKQTILREMEKRDMPLNTKTAIVTLFDSAGSNHINQLYEKSKIETILNAMITNTVVKRKMPGEQAVLQSNLGFQITNKAEKQKDSNLNLDRKLKFYDIDETTGNTTAMQVYLPHYFRKHFGKEFDVKQASDEALQLIGFRIPTEGLNSIDFIEVVGFLPQSAGSTIIVPSEMVAKSGADFDIDKLTIYIPNTEMVEGTIDIVKPFKLKPDGSLGRKELERLRSLDIDVYSQIVSEFVPAYESGMTQDDLDAYLSDMDISRLGTEIEGGIDMTAIQPRQVLQNELLGFIKNVLEHPSSFAQLITPVGALNLEERAEEIHDLQNPGYKTREKNKSIAEHTSFGNIIDTTYNMYQTLGGTGIVASSMTHHTKAQRSGLEWNAEEVQFNFQGINPESLSLSRSRDIFEKSFINASMQKYVSAYVDGEKNPFAMYVNAGKSLASVHMVLLRTGIPLQTVLSFMSQPIIHDYVQAKNELQADTMDDTYTREETLVADLYNKYGDNPSPNIRMFTEERLNEMLGKSFEELSENEKSTQIQVLQDMLRYKEYGIDLLELQQISSYDTTKLKNGNEVIYLKALEQVVKEKNKFINHEALVETSFLKPLRDTFVNSKNLLSSVDLKNSSDIIHNKYIHLAKDLMIGGKYKDDVIYYLDQFDNFLSAYIMLQEREGFTNIAEEVEGMFRGKDSLPRRLKAETAELDNLALDNLLPILDEYAATEHESTIDSIRLVGKKYDVEDLNDLVEEMTALKEENPALFEDLIKFSLAQSGLSYSPYAYGSILPSQDVLALTSPRYTNFVNKVNLHGFNQAYWEKAFESFMANSYSNGRIVPNKYTKSKKLINLLNKDIIPFKQLPNSITDALMKNPYITITHIKNKEDKTYYQDMFRLEGDSLVRQEKRGVRHRFIETSGNIIPGNLVKRARKPLVLGSENIKKILSGDKTNHLLSRGNVINTSGEHYLPDGTIVDLDVYEISKKKLEGSSQASKRLRDNLNISQKNPIFAFANSLGFQDVAGFKKSYPGFFSNRTMDVAAITVISRGAIDLNEDAKGTEFEGSINTLSNVTQEKYNATNKEC